MPLKGFTCEKHGILTFNDALTGKCDCIPRFIYDSLIESNTYDYHKGNVITATTLLGCLRETYFQRTQDYVASPRELYFSWRGTLIHSVFERKNLDGWISEKVVKKPITLKDGSIIEITGKLDGYDEYLKILWDIKTIGDKGIDFIIRDGAKEDQIAQVNIYRWLSDYEIHRLRIIYLSMMTFLQTGHTNRIVKNLKYQPDVEKLKFAYMTPPKDEERNSSGYGPYQLFYETPEIEIWTDDQVTDFILPRATILKDAFDNNIIPPKCDKETQTWKCHGYCNVKEYCDLYEKENKNGADTQA